VCVYHSTPCECFPLLTMSLCLDCIRYGAQLIVEGDITFEQLMTAMLALMLGALGLGQALNDLGDLFHPCLPSSEPSCTLYSCLSPCTVAFLPSCRSLHYCTLLHSHPLLCTLRYSSLPILGPSGDQKEGLLAAKRIFTSIDSGNTSLCYDLFYSDLSLLSLTDLSNAHYSKNSSTTTSHHTTPHSPHLTTPYYTTFSSLPLPSQEKHHQ
jgi:hypothetical protein